RSSGLVFFLIVPAPTEIYTLSLHDALPIFVGLNAIVCVGLNLLIGYAGQISLGHAGFFGLGAYGSALLVANWGVPPFAALVLATDRKSTRLNSSHVKISYAVFCLKKKKKKK